MQLIRRSFRRMPGRCSTYAWQRARMTGLRSIIRASNHPNFVHTSPMRALATSASSLDMAAEDCLFEVTDDDLDVFTFQTAAMPDYM